MNPQCYRYRPGVLVDAVRVLVRKQATVTRFRGRFLFVYTAATTTSLTPFAPSHTVTLARWPEVASHKLWCDLLADSLRTEKKPTSIGGVTSRPGRGTWSAGSPANLEQRTGVECRQPRPTARGRGKRVSRGPVNPRRSSTHTWKAPGF
ncbi:hypothetical protein Bbelb_375080 [Branchiostoma belcheri]|nr:hypothetical protein Bbelb_375080 [Branchiostoma belcheri]